MKYLYVGENQASEIDTFVSDLVAEQVSVEKFRASSDVIRDLWVGSVLVLAGSDCALMAGILKENELLIRRVPKFVFWKILKWRSSAYCWGAAQTWFSIL